jgi:NAD(P)-dependent dehydrogenase (short-subunit alcohol dehydrogenase family)
MCYILPRISHFRYAVVWLRMTPPKRGAIIITGASRGIGAVTAQLAAARGFAVAVNYAQDRASAEVVVQQIVEAGGRAFALQADVAVEADVLRLFDEAQSELGPISALVNNAGVVDGLCRVEAVTAAQFENVFRVNVIGSMLCAREAVRRMSTRHGGAGGAIVNISSLAARTGGAGEWVHYAASKGAIDTFTRGLAREVATEGIRVNAVAPGLVETGLHASAGVPDRPQRLAPTIPMQRAGPARRNRRRRPLAGLSCSVLCNRRHP